MNIDSTGRYTFLTSSVLRRSLGISVLAALALLSGCAGMSGGGRATAPISVKREVPGVVLSMSERTSGGGVRIIGRLDPGIYPITRAAIEYRLAGASDAPPTVPDPNGGGRLALENARSEQVQYRKGSREVSYTIDPGAARNLGNKVLWYRWLITYDRGGPRLDVTDVHRTSLDEAGLPRASGNPGPDTSVVMPGARKR